MTPSGGSGITPTSDLALVQTKDLPKGLDLRLSNGTAGPTPTPRRS
jgi:hypothetical protein